MSCRGEFGEHDTIATQILFGAPIRQGLHVFGPGEVFAVLGSELTHAGKRVRSWAFVLQVPPGSDPESAPTKPAGSEKLPGDFRGAGVRMSFLEGAVEQLCSLVQSRHHRKPGPVCDLVKCVEDFAERRCLEVVPVSFWTMAGITAAGGLGIRTPPDREIKRWRETP